MARDFDYFPTYDPLVKNEVYLSNVWGDFMATFVESLREYMSAHGMFVPKLSLSDINAIQNPVEGQMVYNSSSNSLQIWQIISGAGQWTTIV